MQSQEMEKAPARTMHVRGVLFGLECMFRRLHAGAVMRLAALRSHPLRVTCKPALVVAPHQDDETFGCGGLIAMKRLAGVPVHVVFLTDGRQSHANHAHLQRDDLCDVRRQEALAATRVLGIEPDHVHFLSYPDGRLHELPDETRQALINDLVALIERTRPGEIYFPHRKDRHLDHEAAFELVRDAAARAGTDAELMQYSIWMPWRSPLGWKMRLRDLAGAHRLEIQPVTARKQQAIAAYRSQIDVLPWGFIRRFSEPYEVFFKL